jgi:hypothetical protein
MTVMGDKQNWIAGHKRIEKKSGKPSLLLIEFEEPVYMLRALKGAKNLRDSDTYNEVYVSRDLTRTERLIYKQLRYERNRKNNKDLKETGAGKYPRGSYQGKLFHWGIRNGEVRRIFVLMYYFWFELISE